MVQGSHDYDRGLSEDGEQIFFIFTDYTTIHDDEHEPYYYFRVVILALRDFYKKVQTSKQTYQVTSGYVEAIERQSAPLQ